MQVLDAFIGELMKELKTLGIAENTLVVAMADNGPMVHNPPPGWGMLSLMYRGGKGDFLEGGVRVPAFASWPGMIGKGQSVGDIVHVTDLYTTFARLAGATKYREPVPVLAHIGGGGKVQTYIAATLQQ